MNKHNVSQVPINPASEPLVHNGGREAPGQPEDAHRLAWVLFLTKAVDGHAFSALPEAEGKKVATGSAPKAQRLLHTGIRCKATNLADLRLHTGSDRNERRPRERLRFGRKKRIGPHNFQVYLFPDSSKSNDQEAGTLHSVRERSSSLPTSQHKATNLANVLANSSLGLRARR